MATYPDLTKINLNQNIFGGYNNPIAANYANKLSFIQQYYPKYGSTDARSIDMMYNKAVELTNAYGSSQKSKIGSQLAQTLRTAQAGNVQQPKVESKVVDTPVKDKVVNNTGTSKSSGSNTGKNVNVKDLFNNTNTATVPDSLGNVYAPTGKVDTSAFMNYDYSPVRNISSNQVVPQNNQVIPVTQNTNQANPNQKIWDNESVFGKNPTIQTGSVVPDVNGAVNGSGSNAVQKAMDLQNTLSNKWGNTSYGDAWTQGNGVLGGISNMWDKFTSPNGSMANPTPSGAENFLKSLGGVGTFAGGVADLMYKSKLADLMGRQVSQQEALQNATLKSKNDWEKSYAGSFK